MHFLRFLVTNNVLSVNATVERELLELGIEVDLLVVIDALLDSKGRLFDDTCGIGMAGLDAASLRLMRMLLALRLVETDCGRAYEKKILCILFRHLLLICRMLTLIGMVLSRLRDEGLRFGWLSCADTSFLVGRLVRLTRPSLEDLLPL